MTGYTAEPKSVRVEAILILVAQRIAATVLEHGGWEWEADTLAEWAVTLPWYETGDGSITDEADMSAMPFGGWELDARQYQATSAMSFGGWELDARQYQATSAWLSHRRGIFCRKAESNKQ